MMLITKEIERQLRANRQRAEREICDDTRPVVKFFNPCGAATWLISEMLDDGDTLFGLCDLGMGSPELGYVSLAELQSVRLPFGLTIERDRHWTADKTLAEYADDARAAGRITA